MARKMEDDKKMREWCREIPKIELHAHLNGSIRDSTLLELARGLGENGIIVLEDVEPVILKSSRTLPECFELFDLYHIIATDHSTVTRITKEVVEDFASENVVYLELRTTPKHNEAKGMTKDSYMKAVMQGLNNVDEVEVVLNSTQTSSNEEPETVINSFGNEIKQTRKIHVRILLSIDRRQTTESAIETVDLALKLRDSGVVGIDLSGNPVVGQWSTFLPALKYAKEQGLSVTLHCGEVPNQEEIQAMLEFQPERVGHACCLDYSHWKLLKSSKIPVEICLTSNVRTECVSSLDDHHFADLYNEMHPMAICTDDCGLFSTSLSHEYYIAGTTFGLSRDELYDFAKNAVKLSFVEDEVKKELLKIFDSYKR